LFVDEKMTTCVTIQSEITMSRSETCIICLEGGRGLMANVRCRCSYWYHSRCLQGMATQTKCPMCRAEVGPLYSATAEELPTPSAPPTTRTALRPSGVRTPLVGASVPTTEQQRTVVKYCLAFLLVVVFIIFMVLFVRFIAGDSWSDADSGSP
jgi:hypothetical protein